MAKSIMTVDEMAKRIAQLEEMVNAKHGLDIAKFLEYRGITTPCKKCNGTGSRLYPDITTWSHGIGGQLMTQDICDCCWGSGDADNPWTNLRKVNAIYKERDTLLNVVEAMREIAGPPCWEHEEGNEPKGGCACIGCALGRILHKVRPCSSCTKLRRIIEKALQVLNVSRLGYIQLGPTVLLASHREARAILDEFKKNK